MLSSKELSKYEHLTGEDLGYILVEQAKFEYFQLGKVLNEGLEIEDKKEGLLQRLKILKTRIKSRKKKLYIKKKDNYMWLISKEKTVKGKDGVLLDYHEDFTNKGRKTLKNSSIVELVSLMHFFPGNLEVDIAAEYLEPEPSFEESISERTKMRRQKKSDKENQEEQY